MYKIQIFLAYLNGFWFLANAACVMWGHAGFINYGAAVICGVFCVMCMVFARKIKAINKEW